MAEEAEQQPSVPASPGLQPAKNAMSWRRLLIWLLGIVLAEVVASGITWPQFISKFITPPASTQVVGQIFFLSSPNAPLGNLDEVQLTLRDIPDAPAGKHYYAWLATTNDSIQPIHWTFTVDNGQVNSLYTDPQHMNLLTNHPYLFLITLQSIDTGVPSFEPGARLYYASIPITQPPAHGFSLVVLSCPQSSSNNVCMS